MAWNPLRTGVRLPFFLLIVLLVVALPGVPSAEEKDRAIEQTILRQIEAFANNDHEAAWAFASDGIKRRFGDADVFFSMVREAYPAVHRASTIEFVQRVPHGGFDIQVVRLTGPDGKRWDAYYRMVRSDGDWRVAGVQLQPTDMGI
ncbi:MAG: DUF4864 domain-containing protein [Marinobacter sp.]|nr:DUF4864 domain-containing protein [Marinobacter sp.]